MRARYTLLPILAAVIALPLQSHAAETVFFPQLYAGIALGKSTLAPQSNTALSDDSDSGFKLLLGYDLGERSSVELHFADLGAARFADDSTLSYSTFGVEYVYQAYANYGLSGLERREGFMAFTKIGLGLLDTNGEGIDIEREHDWHLSLGAGVGIDLMERTRLRLEFNAYDTDAHLLTLGIVRRIGVAPSWPFGNKVPAPVPTPVLQAPAPAAPKAVQPPPSDVDADGVDDRRDLCPATPPKRRVDESGCVFGGILEGVQFELASAALTLPARARLDAVIQDMQRYPKLRVQITAHTDNQGSGQYNLQLSIKRARSVAEYLIEHGISPDRLRAVGAGESQPIYRNDNRSGRQGNRRVEFKVLNY